MTLQRLERRTSASSNKIDDAVSVTLIAVIVCLVLSILLWRPDIAQLTPEQISQMPKHQFRQVVRLSPNPEKDQDKRQFERARASRPGFIIMPPYTRADRRAMAAPTSRPASAAVAKAVSGSI
jgi:hypothetical protein